MSSLKSLAILLLAVAVGLADDDLAQEFYQEQRWFELRDMQIEDRFAAEFIAGSVAAAFNRQQDAEAHLKRAIHLGKRPRQIVTAREALANLYLREGRMREAVQQFRASMKTDSSRYEPRAAIAEFGRLATASDFSAHLPLGGSSFPCEVKDTGVSFPLIVNGKKVIWSLNTGLDLSAVSESEARSLDVAIYDQKEPSGDDSPAPDRPKIGLAAKITVGNLEFHNVPLSVVSDKKQPFGMIGSSLALAMQTISWKRDGACRAGFSSDTKDPANLALDGFTPIVRGTLDGKPLDLVLDTGNPSATQLWRRFRSEFPDDDGPIVRFEVGGTRITAKPSHAPGDDWHHGLIGMEALSQASEVILDFRAMTVVLR